ncbi:MAG: DUF4492 domain-containing protein [Dysgonamonadaceae bacterium]|jgi:hypothetical protein|nr:DUF4492 domain-containing protein [Dysgonamonadaceae bacterium]
MGNTRSFAGFIAMYVDGFKNLTWGKPLWILIFIKLFIFFAVLKVFFFPNILNSRFKTEQEKSDFVFKELMEKQHTNEKNLSNESD